MPVDIMTDGAPVIHQHEGYYIKAEIWVLMA